MEITKYVHEKKKKEYQEKKEKFQHSYGRRQKAHPSLNTHRKEIHKLNFGS